MWPKKEPSNALRTHNVLSRLALYVSEYLLHVGAQKAAQTFLNEVSWIC